jgi:hypothetical protein
MKIRLLAILTFMAVSVQMSGIAVVAQQQPLTAKVTLKRDGRIDQQASVLASGAPFETARDIEAEIEFPPVGKIKVFPSAKVLPMFDATSISVAVREGCASLFVEKGYSGRLTRPDGTVQQIEAGNAAEINSCDRLAAGAVGGGGGSGTGVGGAAGGVGGASVGSGISSSILASIVIAGGVLGAVLWTFVFNDDLPDTVSPSR